MPAPVVSILIPTYNQGSYIEKAIESALAQDYENLQVVVSDDSTDDETEILVKKYSGDKRFLYSRNRPGLGKAGNYAKLLYELAAGEWVVNLDGDDYYTDNSFISTAIKSIYSRGAEDVVFYMASQIMAYPYRDQLLQPHLPGEETVMTAGDYVYRIYSILHFSHLSALYNASLARQSGFYQKAIISSDMHSFFKLCLRNKDKKIILSKKIVGKWVQHGANESRDHSFQKHYQNGKYYFDIFRFAVKNKTAGIGENISWLSKSLFLYWGSWLKRLFIKRK